MSAMYYDIDYESVENKIDDFLNQLILLHDAKNLNEIKDLLDINPNVNHNYKTTYNNDEIEYEYVSVKSNDYIKRTIDVIRYILSSNVFTLWINSVLVKWNNKLNKTFLTTKEVDSLIEKCNFERIYESNKVISFTVNKNTWDSFKIRCFRLDLTISEGLKCAVVDFVINEK